MFRLRYILLFALFLSLNSFAKRDSLGNKVYNEWVGLKLGAYAGTTISNMRSHAQTQVGEYVFRPNFGASFQYDISKFWALEFDLDLISRGYRLKDSVKDFLGNYEANRTVETKLTYLSLPALLKFNIRKNGGFYLLAGGHFSILMGSRKNVELDYGTSIETSSEKGFNTYESDAGTILGLGVEIPIKKYQLAIEARHNLGFRPVTAEVGYPYQHNQSVVLFMAFRYKLPKPVKKYKGVGDL